MGFEEVPSGDDDHDNDSGMDSDGRPSFIGGGIGSRSGSGSRGVGIEGTVAPHIASDRVAGGGGRLPKGGEVRRLVKKVGALMRDHSPSSSLEALQVEEARVTLWVRDVGSYRFRFRVLKGRWVMSGVMVLGMGW